jgi:GNAT superfamily N-acetyltransferase
MNLSYANSITVEQYNSLRKSVGWNEIQSDLAERGLQNTAYLVVLTDDGVPFALARVITDYGYTVLISDVVVHPDYQGSGCGRMLMTKVMDYIDRSIAPGQMKMINLMAAQGKEGFYKKFGFLERPYDGKGAGMSQWLSCEAAV